VITSGGAAAAAWPVLGALAGCQAPGDQGGQPSLSRAPATVQLTYQADAQDDEILSKDFVPKFQAASPHVTVQFLTVAEGGSAYIQKVTAMHAAGTPPDAYWVQHAYFPSLAAQGMLLKLGTYARREGARARLDDFYPTILDSSRFKNELYGLPFLGGIYVVMYNQRHFQQAGVPLPADQAQQGRWTTEAFLDAARRLTQSSGTEVARFGTNVTLGFTDSAPWLWADGGDWFNLDQSALVIDRPDSVRALQFQADLAHKHRVAAKPGEQVAGGRNANFGQQTLAMSVQWSTGSRGYLATADLDWDAAPMPKGPARPLTQHGYNPVSISSGSKVADAAWELATFLSGPYVVQTWTERGRIMATRKSAGDSARFVDALPPGFRQLARAGVSASRAKPVVAKQAEVERAIDPELKALAEGRKNASDAATEMKRLAEPILKAG
jgi:multiple sugar transport system substrate-binding protein